MPIASTAERNSLAGKYGVDTPYAALFTADPGTSGSAAGEVTGGAPAYARKALVWGAPVGGVVTASATFDVPAGTTVAYVGACASSVAGTADVRDRTGVVSQTFATQGQYTANFNFTMS